IVDHALERLAQLGLVDDDSFARRWVEERAAAKGFGSAKLVAELEAKGIDRDLALQAVSQVDSEETDRAKAVALRLVPRVARRPLAAQAAALAQMLARRGFGEEPVEAAVRSVLPPEGWD
ncbi:MAG: RecX family transcriptional regulator, partial [Actinomycetota bacterium]|nr:RecX family transcriptional regulator [Actinomycetota bacterium]